MRGGSVGLADRDRRLACSDKPQGPQPRGIQAADRYAELFLSPYALVEVDLLVKSGSLIVSYVKRFWEKLAEALQYHEVTVLPPKPEYHGEAHMLRERHGLSYFDSLHAAIAVVERLRLVSYDRNAYHGIPGLDYQHPAAVL